MFLGVSSEVERLSTYLLHIVFSRIYSFLSCAHFSAGLLAFSLLISRNYLWIWWWYIIGYIGCKYILPDWGLYFLLYGWYLLLNRILNFNVSDAPHCMFCGLVWNLMSSLAVLYFCMKVFTHLMWSTLFCFVFGRACGMWKFSGQRWNPRYSSDPSDNSGSLPAEPPGNTEASFLLSFWLHGCSRLLPSVTHGGHTRTRGVLSRSRHSFIIYLPTPDLSSDEISPAAWGVSLTLIIRRVLAIFDPLLLDIDFVQQLEKPLLDIGWRCVHLIFAVTSREFSSCWWGFLLGKMAQLKG